ncbi:DUF6494 family protein [Donghicola tyrosinivorans]|jgi:transcriptional regulator of NAD metabolism|uniref:Uncharacterized protein n=1 Tax=Donghicola tyrosinivorans TaxID=1652492 RepID=A0A2T0WWJ0_9RHOB|nr:DUF6494 family protein [Donghicola tyrosinivorans]MEC9196229.1 DUF6494 family protein [Pseudomonadota bacterium]MEE3071534.1 DUF6494 family protein [Pseudomonadota bacterium]PRY91060.1 hypothetical protein CLV74_10472 [Donghicola tyrosinivorans]
MDDELNMSVRKFLKQVGVTSQKAIEDALRAEGVDPAKARQVKMVLTIDDLGVEHVVTGEIKGSQE